MKMIIDGEKVDASDGRAIEVLNPATMEVIDTVPAATTEDLDRALNAAAAGFPAWKATPARERVAIIRKFCDLMRENIDELAQIMCAENGKILSECYTEIDACIGIFESYSAAVLDYGGLTMPRDSEPRADGDIILTLREPLGVVAAIVPFNYPIELYAHKVAPALLTGNTVIVKPASDTPMSALYTTDLLLRAGIPGNVLQIVTGSGSKIGSYLSSSPKVAAVSLTGSVPAGVSVAENAAKNLSRVYLELGGNDPLIIFDDADLDRAVKETVVGRATNAGQTCCATKRILVQNGIKEEFTRKLIDSLQKMKAGNPAEEGTDFGPLINEKAAVTVEEQVNKTLDQGATLALGGHRFNHTFYELTVLTDVMPDMDIATDMEVFGPVFPIIGFDTAEEAIEIANASPFGLGSGVMSGDFSKALKVANEIQSGTCVINGSGNYRCAAMAFGGYKKSGLGREGTCQTLDEYTQTKNVVLRNYL